MSEYTLIQADEGGVDHAILKNPANHHWSGVIGNPAETGETGL